MGLSKGFGFCRLRVACQGKDAEPVELEVQQKARMTALPCRPVPPTTRNVCDDILYREAKALENDLARANGE